MNIKQKKYEIIVQAGGSGSRLRHFTWNKPKCLVSYEGKPVIFYLFDLFQKSNFYIVGDYQIDKIKRYFKINAPPVNFKIYKTTEKGTCSGIKDALKDINEKNFSGAAIIHSISDSVKNGGNIGWVKETFLSPNIKKKLGNLENGDITSPIVIPGGFLILKIENTREIDVEFDLEQEIQNIIKKKTNEQLNQLSNIYFNKIKKNIEVNEL